MPRAHVPAAAGWHHAMGRWSATAESFLGSLCHAHAAFQIEVHAFCVLPSHYHLLVRAETSYLCAALAWVNRRSPCPRGRAARVVPVAYGRHLTAVSRYIHLNPVDAGLAWRPETWAYSSFGSYLGTEGAPRWIATSAILGRFGTIGARHRHKAYVYAGMDPGTRDADGRPRWWGMLGGESLIQDLAWRVDPVLALPEELPEASQPKISLWRLAEAVAIEFNVKAAVLRAARTGGPPAAAARGALVHAARQLRSFRPREVAAFMGYAGPGSAAAAAERFAEAARVDRSLAGRVARAMSRITFAS